MGLYVYSRMRGSVYVRVFAADVAATVFLYLVSLPLGNASVYDPYWSVAPLVILPLCMLEFGAWNAGTIALLVCVAYWGIRLTANWAYTFHGYDHQDWRYTMLAEKSGALYPLVSLFGIMLFPTLVVYLCLLPALHYIQTGGVNLFTLLGFALCLSAATLQLIADVPIASLSAAGGKPRPDHPQRRLAARAAPELSGRNTDVVGRLRGAALRAARSLAAGVGRDCQHADVSLYQHPDGRDAHGGV